MGDRKKVSNWFRIFGRFLEKPYLVSNWFNGRCSYRINYPFFITKFPSSNSSSNCKTVAPPFTCSLAFSKISIPLSVTEYCPLKQLKFTFGKSEPSFPFTAQSSKFVLVASFFNALCHATRTKYLKHSKPVSKENRCTTLAAFKLLLYFSTTPPPTPPPPY